ncbi:ComEC/Rec2 family competence protein [Candidatus Uhrbacteria bacterium]|nr:ComEC/Rec2 family competence protein [Candidatus Uhrbacteria bacterium]
MQSFAERAGYYLGAFLVGVFLHSLWPQVPAPIVPITFGVALLVLLYIQIKHPMSRFVCICLLAALLGVWRFDLARPGLAASVRPFDPNGFAYNRQITDTPIEKWMENHRLAISRRIHSVLPGDEGALLSGILYGERSLSAEAKQAFKDAGLTHVVAVSGSNVMIVVLALGKVFSLLGFSRKRAFIYLSFSLVAFVLFVTPQAPVVRAAIMGWLMTLAPIIGRLPSSGRLLLVSASVFVMWQPQALLFDPSFALSFLATAGLMTWGSWLDRLLEKRLPWDVFRETLSATFGATLMTTPYTAWAFGQASIFGILTNLAAVPLIPWIMGSGMVLMIFPHPILALPAQGLLASLLWISRLPSIFGLVSIPVAVSPWFAVGCYIPMAYLWFRVSRNPQLASDNNSKTLDLTDSGLEKRLG